LKDKKKFKKKEVVAVILQAEVIKKPVRVHVIKDTTTEMITEDKIF